MKKIRKIEKRNQYRKKIMCMAVMLLICMTCYTIPVFASSAIITSKFNTLKDIVAGVVTAIGAIVVLWGIFEFGNAMQTQDGGAQSQALKRIGGGLVMVIASQLLALLV